MKVFFATLNPCAARMVNVQQHMDFVTSCGHVVVDKPSEADIIFVWGCEFRKDWASFTQEILYDLTQEYPAKIVYMGCTLKTSSWNENGVITIPWKDTKKMFESIFTDNKEKLVSDVPMVYAVPPVANNIEEYKKRNPNARVWFEDEYIKVNICEGCLEYCTYCSEKLMFPRFRSFPEQEIIRQTVAILKQNKGNKVLLFGDSTGDYGKDTGTSIENLINNIRANTDTRTTFGITQLNPQHFLNKESIMLDFIENGVIDYLNLPVQSLSDNILTNMNRKYNAAQAESLFQTLNRVGFNNFSSHLLIGFPGETMDDVKKAIEFFSKYKPRHIIASAFMTHPNIKASKFPGQISQQEKLDRLDFCKSELAKAGVKVFTDNQSTNNRIMNKIRLGLFDKGEKTR